MYNLRVWGSYGIVIWYGALATVILLSIRINWFNWISAGQMQGRLDNVIFKYFINSLSAFIPVAHSVDIFSYLFMISHTMYSDSLVAIMLSCRCVGFTCTYTYMSILLLHAPVFLLFYLTLSSCHVNLITNTRCISFLWNLRLMPIL